MKKMIKKTGTTMMRMIMIYKKTDKYGGTYLQGYITCSYDDLVTVFGNQHSKGDEWKVSCQWAFEFEDGTP